MKPSAIYLITWAWSLRRSDCGDNTSPDLRTHLNNTGNMCSVTAPTLGPGMEDWPNYCGLAPDYSINTCSYRSMVN